jgi:DNA-directed RNA polymerase specialized sigma24 family protein
MIRETEPMAGDSSVTIWLDGMKAGDNQAIQKLWDRYFQRLVRLAARRLPGDARRDIDEEDVALSAFQTFCEHAGRGRFPQLSDRDDLWRLLAVITARKVIGVVRQRASQKRGGGNVSGESAMLEGARPGEIGLAQVPGRELSPEFAAQLAEEYQRMLESLGDERLRVVFRLKLEGHDPRDIARKLGISTRTVERKLHLIRIVLERHAIVSDSRAIGSNPRVAPQVPIEVAPPSFAPDRMGEGSGNQSR